MQKYATSKLGLESGDYSYVAEMIENEFVQSSLRILLEYGIPLSAVQKLQIILPLRGINPRLETEDQIMNIIKERKEEIYPYLSIYERDLLDRAL